jgi:hypothetical protein
VKQPKKNSPLLYCSNRPGQRERERQTCFFSVAGRRQSRTETKSAGEGRRTIEEAGHRERSGRRDHRICRRERERERARICRSGTRRTTEKAERREKPATSLTGCGTVQQRNFREREWRGQRWRGNG